MGGGVAGNGAHFSVITAITISGCSLLFLALVRRSRLAHKDEGDASSSGAKRRKKKNMAVRFSEDVAEPRSNGAEYRTRLRPRRRGRPAQAVGGGDRASRGGRPADDPQDRKTKAVDCGGSDGAGGEDTSIPGNRSALYRGLCQYRSQMATVMRYHA